MASCLRAVCTRHRLGPATLSMFSSVCCVRNGEVACRQIARFQIGFSAVGCMPLWGVCGAVSLGATNAVSLCRCEPAPQPPQTPKDAMVLISWAHTKVTSTKLTRFGPLNFGPRSPLPISNLALSYHCNIVPIIFVVLINVNFQFTFVTYRLSI